MNLYPMLLARQEAVRPVTVALIGAGKYGTMFLAQTRTTPGMQIVAVADLNVARARSQLAACHWPAERIAARSCAEALRTGGTFLTDGADALVRADGIEVVIEATGDPRTGIRLALAAIGAGKHVVMVNVEADVVAGPLLARRARGRPASSTRWPTATSRRSCASMSTGPAPAASPSWPRARARATCRATTNRRPRRCSTTCPA